MNKLLVAALFILFSQLSFSEAHHEAAEGYKPEPLKGGLFWLAGGKGGNILLSTGDDGVLLVDNDYKELSPALKEVLINFGGIDNVDFVINTHWHGDHSEGNFLLGRNSTIVAHENVRKRLSTDQSIPFFKMESKPYPKDALPDITYKSDTTIHHNGYTIELIHFPNSHTDSDSVVFFKEANLAHMGDLYFNGFFPFVDVDNGGNVLKMAANIDQILARLDEASIVVPGHGPMSNKQELQQFNAMLKGTSKEVAALKNSGVSLEKIQKQGLSKEWKRWTKGFIPEQAWIAMIYASLD